MKRAYKLQEFVAHTSNVNCLKIGRKSAGVLVTGGEDKKVNVWAIGKPTAVLSLSGHQSPVECVCFDSAEEVIVAGATGGTVKLWDLEQAKVIRTLTGHRSSCLSVDFHPFGEFFASGSLDTSVKVWDVRRKACISTYKGHSRGVSNVQFSPDGRLLTSGGQDGELKVWDLAAGKLLHEFRHEEGITGIEYHPSEFILATSSADRTVKWWDLETSELIDTAGPDISGVKSIAFPANGDCLLAAVQDGLQVWAWEPVTRLDTVDIPWAKMRDMSLNEQDGKLVACSCNNSFVGVWVLDLNKLKPFSGPAVRHAPSQSPQVKSLRQSFCMPSPPRSPAPLEPPAASGSPLLQQQLPSPMPGLLAAAVPDQQPCALSPALIRATRAPTQLGRSSLRNAISAPCTSQPGLPNSPIPHTPVNTPVNRQRHPTLSPAVGPSRTPDPISASSFRQLLIDAGNSPTAHQPNHAAGQGNANEDTAGRQQPDTMVASCTELCSSSGSMMPGMQEKSVAPATGGLVEYSCDDSVQPKGVGRNVAWRQAGLRGTAERTGSEPCGLDVAAFLPPSLSPRQGTSVGVVSDTEVMAQLTANHQTVMSILSSRQATLQVVKGFWVHGDAGGALSAILQAADASVAMDVLRAVRDSPQLLKLDYCSQIASCLRLLLVTAHETYIQAAVTLAAVLLNTFGDVIQQTCRQDVSSVGVDLSFDERRQKCQNARDGLKQLCQPLQTLVDRTGNPLLIASSLLGMLNSL